MDGDTSNLDLLEKDANDEYDWRSRFKEKTDSRRRDYGQFLSVKDATRTSRSASPGPSPTASIPPIQAGSAATSRHVPPSPSPVGNSVDCVEPPVSSRSTSQVVIHQIHCGRLLTIILDCCASYIRRRRRPSAYGS